jgi:hypothetical protein
MKPISSRSWRACAALVCLSGCTSAHGGGDGSSGPTLAGNRVASSDLVLECSAANSGNAWQCPAAQTVDCRDLASTRIVVRSPAGTTCSADALELSPDADLGPGTHTLSVRDASGVSLCSTTLTVEADPPRLEPKVVQLWPPNHKFHDISIDDCVDVTSACGEPLEAQFVWASSDEPVDDIGDGHFAPDIELADDCQHVAVRSERQGPENGRVYKLGVRVTDASGQSSEAVCDVIVDHDQRGVVGADSGEAYRITFDGKNGGPTCDGTQPPPPVTPPPPPPVTPPPPASGEAPL